jgi:hypothetical protein
LVLAHGLFIPFHIFRMDSNGFILIKKIIGKRNEIRKL